MQTLSFNGLDGSGKTEQVNLLRWSHPELFHFSNPLAEYSECWPKLDPLQMSKWWFEEIPIDKFISIIIASLNERNRDIATGKITVHDRGQRMYQAVCVATWCTREDITYEEAMDKVANRFSREIENPPEEMEIFLNVDPTYQLSISPYLQHVMKKPKRPEWMDRRYARYQQNLHFALSSLCQIKSPNVEVVVDDCAILVHNQICHHLNKSFGLQLSPAIEHLKLLIGFGGYSESGKSSFADRLRLEFGFVRLKFRFFSQSLRANNSEVNPQTISYEVMRFIEQHPFAEYFSVESLHGFNASAYLKLLLGNRYKVIFMDAGREQRIARMADKTGIGHKEAEIIIDEKDAKKRQNGSEIVREKADLLVDNSISSKQSFSNLLRELGLSDPVTSLGL